MIINPARKLLGASGCGFVLGALVVLAQPSIAEPVSSTRIGPETTDPAWHIPLADENANSEPGHKDYEKLLVAYERYRAILKRGGGWNTIADGPDLQIGDRDSRVDLIRRRLRATGDFKAQVEADSFFFDTGIDAAVRNFQKRHRLRINGIVDLKTRTALNVPVEDRILQIAVALQRWRWLPRNLGTNYVWVNVPESKLVLVIDGDEVLSMPVIVGHPERPTPSFRSNLRQVVFNPPWSVPHTIAVEDLLPQQQRHPDFLARNRIRVYRGWGDAPTEIPVEQIDWQKLSAGHFPYRFVQDPGPTNSLGRVKFVMDNPFDVFLHDSPAWRLFYLSTRTLSSGCVRLADAPAFVSALMNRDQGWTERDVVERLLPGPTDHINLTRQVPVYVVYFTTWIGEDQQLYFARDVYRRDEQLATALIRTRLAQLLY